MAYTYALEPSAMFEDRAHQIAAFGIPAGDISSLRASIKEMWANAPGGWVYEWSRLASRYSTEGNHYLAAMAYGWAKFPCLANEARSNALAMQVKEYVVASAHFPVQFERRIINISHGDKTTGIALHLLGGPKNRADAPVLVASGGVDTWKMDTHPLFVALAKATGLTVLAFDHPGTGETQLPLDAEADEVVRNIVREARALGNGQVAHFGMSFGGNFSAMTGLSGAVDAAINLGGPVDAAFNDSNLAQLPYGMKDILGNAFGFDQQPGLPEITKRASVLSRRRLLQQESNATMLVINGEDDYFVPQADTLIFKARPDTEVHLIPGTGHCAISRMGEVMPIMIRWIQKWAASNGAQGNQS